MAEPAEDQGADLAPDASLATDIPDEDSRRAEQMEYYGGDEDDIDTEDFLNADRGDSLEPPEAEEEEEVEAEEEEEVEAEEEEEVEAKQADPRIPIARFNEVNERMKLAERKLAEIEAQQQAAQKSSEEAYDFDSAEAEYQDLLLDGKTTEATAKRKEIRAAEQALWKHEAMGETMREVTQQEMLRELDSLTAQAAQMYPIFDEQSAEYDQFATQQVVTYMRGYSQDKAPPDAFVTALADVIQLYDLDSKYGYAEEEPAKSKPTKKAAPKKKTKEKLEVAEKQVRSPVGAGSGSNEAGAVVPDIEKMSDAEIDALPAETLARLRGDFV